MYGAVQENVDTIRHIRAESIEEAKRLRRSKYFQSSTSGIYRASHALGGMAINNLLTSLNMPYLVAAYGVFSQITVYIRSSWSSASSNLLVFSGIFVGEEDRN